MSCGNMNADKSATVVAFSASTLIRPKFKALPPLSLYVHIPWCLKKCPYCDFNSHEARDDVPEGAYIDDLLEDLEFALPSIRGRSVVSVFIGGGTQRLFSPESIDQLLSAICARVAFYPDV